MWYVGTLFPFSCHLFLDSGAQRMRGVWERLSLSHVHSLFPSGFDEMLSMRDVWDCLSPSCAISSWTQGLRECAVCGDTCPPLVLFLFFDQDLVGHRVRVVCGDACPPLVPSLLGLRGSENMGCVGTLVPLLCCFSFSIRLWWDVEKAQSLGVLVPLSCYLALCLDSENAQYEW